MVADKHRQVEHLGRNALQRIEMNYEESDVKGNPLERSKGEVP